MCNLLNLSRDSYYKRHQRVSNCGVKRELVLELVRDVRVDEPRTGTRKVHHRISPKLAKLGLSFGRDKLFSLLKEELMLIKPKKSYSRTTYSKHGYAVAPNRLKSSSIEGPEEALVSDITYLRLKRGFAYLFLVTDAFSRKILGYHLSKDLSHYSAVLALEMAIDSLSDSRGVIHHSDRGSQYCCHEFLSFLGEHGIVPSMTDESHCYQNAIAERVNGILKDEFFLDATFTNFEEAQQTVQKAIEIYNNKRTHWSLGLKTPAQVHREAA